MTIDCATSCIWCGGEPDHPRHSAEAWPRHDFKARTTPDESPYPIEKRFATGQKVLRYMGEAGGYWAGTVTAVSPGRVIINFGADGGIAIGFDIDEHLLAADDPTAAAKVAASLQRQRELQEKIDRPMWPVGYFGEEGGGDGPEGQG